MISVRPSFELVRPGSLAELHTLMGALQASKQDFMLSAGGTDIVPYLKRSQAEPQTVVSLGGLGELRKISSQREGAQTVLQLGALCTLAEISKHPELEAALPALTQAAGSVASPQIRNRATLGGNLLADNRCVYFNQSEENRCTFGACYKAGGDACHLVPNAKPGKMPLCRARFISDLAPVLMCLDARMILSGSKGERAISLREFYLQDGIERNRLEKGEILTRVEVRPVLGAKVCYEKLRIRNAIDFPSVGVAVGRQLKDGEEVWSFAVTGINPFPIFVKESLGSAQRTEAHRMSLIEKGASEATRLAVPLKQDFFPPSYRKKMISVLIRRCAKQVSSEGV